MSDLTARLLLDTPAVAVRDVWCAGRCRHPSNEEAAHALHIVFPYRGVYVRHLGSDQAVADANQVLFFNPDEGYRVSHPQPGGDASLDIVLPTSVVRELAPAHLARGDSALTFREQRHPIDAHAQAMAARLRHRLRAGLVNPLEGEARVLALVQRVLRPDASCRPGGTAARRRLVDRTKLLLSASLTKRWTLTEVARLVGHSPVYLTQSFQQVEGLPLYRYQRRLRLARALELLGDRDDLTALALDLGFSSHSHFSTAFREVYGRSPSTFRREAGRHNTVRAARHI